MDSKSIVGHFGDLPVPREDDRRDLLLDVIVIVICASICAAEKWNGIEAFGLAKESWLRRSHDEANRNSAIQMVSAWASPAGLTLAQVKLEERSDEITAISELLKMLELSGCVATIDAIGTQPDIAEQIKMFFDQIETDRDTAKLCDYHKSVNKDHGRIEIRECWATGDLSWLEGRERFKGLSSICVVKSQRTIDEQVAHLVRAHRGIENSRSCATSRSTF